MYAAFIRPGLEYGLPLIPIGHSTLQLLSQCQKRILCRFLGVHVNARNDIIAAISNCPSIPYRHDMLLHRRTCRLISTWNSDHSSDYSLVFISRGITGTDFIPPPDFNSSLSPSILRTDLYVIPVSTSLTTRFEGNLLISTLRCVFALDTALSVCFYCGSCVVGTSSVPLVVVSNALNCSISRLIS